MHDLIPRTRNFPPGGIPQDPLGGGRFRWGPPRFEWGDDANDVLQSSVLAARQVQLLEK